MKDALTPLADKYKCDKGNRKHKYTKIYNDYFHSMRDEWFKMLEIGFGKGASIKMWAEYFCNAIIYCADILEELPKDALIKKYINQGKFRFFTADQSSTKQLSKLLDRGSEFKIILDDGSHRAEDQQYTFGYLFPHLISGGWYIIEDLNCRRTPNKDFEIGAVKTIKVLRNYNKSGHFDSRVLTKEQMGYIDEHIDRIEIFNATIAFIKKKGIK